MMEIGSLSIKNKLIQINIQGTIFSECSNLFIKPEHLFCSSIQFCSCFCEHFVKYKHTHNVNRDILVSKQDIRRQWLVCLDGKSAYLKKHQVFACKQ